MNSHTYTIIPSLVSINSERETINDFLMGENLKFYPSHKTQILYHVSFSNSFASLQEDMDHIGNYSINNSTLYYKRHLFAPLSFEFSYEYKKNFFKFNDLYKIHKVNIGDIFTVGRHVFHRIERDLLERGYLLLLSAAIRYKNKTYLLLAPNGAGKTSWVFTMLKKGASYISENYSIIFPETQCVFGISPIFNNKGRRSNILLKELFSDNRVSITQYSKIDTIYILRLPGQENLSREELIRSYIYTFTQYYLKNNSIRTLDYFLGNKHFGNLEFYISFLSKKTKMITSMQEIV